MRTYLVGAAFFGEGSLLNQWLWLICLTFGIINAIYYIFFYRAFVSLILSNKNLPPVQPGVSVIICSRNGLEYLKAHLLHWIDQNYPDFEVIIVDDGSIDGTKDWLEYQCSQFARLKGIYIPIESKTQPGKKAALTNGIKQATKEWILLTDVDCKPTSHYWIHKMMEKVSEDISFIVGIAPITSGVSIASKLASLESVLTCMQYMSWAHANKPYMAVGRNLAYRKTTFEELNGFEKHDHIISGDDDLMIQAGVQLQKNVALALDPKAFTISDPPSSFQQYFNKKSRHVSTSSYYDRFSKTQLGIFAASHLVFYALAIGLVFTSSFFWAAMLVGMRWIFIYPAWRKWHQHLMGKSTIVWTLIFDLFLIYYYFRLTKAVVVNNKHW